MDTKYIELYAQNNTSADVTFENYIPAYIKLIMRACLIFFLQQFEA
jgi:hypothetical protein